MGPTRPSLEYLLTCSNDGLESFELSRLNQASMLRKEARQVFEQLIEMEVDARLARCILECKRGDISFAEVGERQLGSLPPQRQIASSESAQIQPLLALSPAPNHRLARAPGTRDADSPAESAPSNARRLVASASHNRTNSGTQQSLASPLHPISCRPFSLGREEESALEDLEAFLRAPSAKASPATEPSTANSEHQAPPKSDSLPGSQRLAMLRESRRAAARKPVCHDVPRIHRAS